MKFIYIFAYFWSEVHVYFEINYFFTDAIAAAAAAQFPSEVEGGESGGGKVEGSGGVHHVLSQGVREDRVSQGLMYLHLAEKMPRKPQKCLKCTGK